MRKAFMAPLAALLVACGGGGDQRVERPVEEVRASLTSMPIESDAMALATPLPDTEYWLEPQGDRLVWHFTRQGRDYGRLVATLEPAGSGATRVTTRFEAERADDAEGDLSLLRGMAEIAGEESVRATLEGRPFDRPALTARFQEHAERNPTAARAATILTVDAR